MTHTTTSRPAPLSVLTPGDAHALGEIVERLARAYTRSADLGLIHSAVDLVEQSVQTSTIDPATMLHQAVGMLDLVALDDLAPESRDIIVNVSSDLETIARRASAVTR